MATLDNSEVAEIKALLFENVLGTGAIPYIDIKAVYDILRDNVSSSSTAATSSSTAVTAAGPTTITVASATGLAAGTRVQLDVDDAREIVTIRSVTGAVLSIVATKTHSGTYPVEIPSALTIVRGLLSDLRTLDRKEREGAFDALGLKQVDEVIWKDGSITAAYHEQRSAMLARLAAACGLGSIYQRNLAQARGGSTFEVY